MGRLYFEIEWFLGGDWKFFVCVCGFGVVIVIYFCIWCKCLLYDKYDKRKEWFFFDILKGVRIVREIE